MAATACGFAAAAAIATWGSGCIGSSDLNLSLLLLLLLLLANLLLLLSLRSSSAFPFGAAALDVRSSGEASTVLATPAAGA